MSRRHLNLLCCIATALAVATGAWGQDRPPPVNVPQLIKDLFLHAQFSQASLSPNGTLMGVLVPREHRVVLEIMDLKKSSAWVLARFGDADVTGFSWVNDHRVVVFIADLKSGSGENYLGGFYAVNVDGGRIRSFGVFGKPIRYAASFEDGSDDVLATTREYDESVDAFQVDTSTGGMRSLVVGVPHRATQLTFDHKMRLRALVVDSSDAKRAAMWYRPGVDAPWTVLGDFDITEPGFTPVGFSTDDRTCMWRLRTTTATTRCSRSIRSSASWERSCLHAADSMSTAD